MNTQGRKRLECKHPCTVPTPFLCRFTRLTRSGPWNPLCVWPPNRTADLTCKRISPPLATCIGTDSPDSLDQKRRRSGLSLHMHHQCITNIASPPKCSTTHVSQCITACASPTCITMRGEHIMMPGHSQHGMGA